MAHCFVFMASALTESFHSIDDLLLECSGVKGMRI